MKQQIIVIHGGEAYSNYNAFLEALKTRPVTLTEEVLIKSWRHNLQNDIGNGYDVILPSMPNKQNSKYQEWALWFERYLEIMELKVIFVGHSQGAMFLVRYFSENKLSCESIKSLHLIAGAYEKNLSKGDDGGDFFAEKDAMATLEKRDFPLFLYHSKDDFVVPYAQSEFFHSIVPRGTVRSFTDKNHFLIEHFPELIEDIKDMA